MQESKCQFYLQETQEGGCSLLEAGHSHLHPWEGDGATEMPLLYLVPVILMVIVQQRYLCIWLTLFYCANNLYYDFAMLSV